MKWIRLPLDRLRITMLAPVTDLVHLILLISGMVRFGVAPMIRHWLGLPISTHDLGVRLRLFLDRGGLIYRKLGQYLAMRTDLLPPAICGELDRLFEDAIPMPFFEVERLIEAELGRPWRQCFAWIDPQPTGSASVAQVHAAIALDNERLAIKVQRTGIQQQFIADVRVFRRLARLVDLFRLAGVLSVRQFFDEFVRFTERELDFELEAHTADRLRLGMSPYGYVPRVRWDLTTSRLLSMEFVEGETFLTLCKLGESGRTQEIERILSGLDLHTIVSHLADECFHQLFATGFFHGDPHPGNVILRRDGTFVFLDFGIAGDLPDDHRRDLTGFIENLALARFTESAYYYTRLCELTAATDADAWMYDITSTLAEWYVDFADPHAPIERRHIGRLQNNVALAMRRHNVIARSNQVLVWRALVLLDTTTLRLPVHLDVLAAMVSFFQRLRGNLPAILDRAFQNWLVEAPRISRGLISPIRLLLTGGDRPVSMTIMRYGTTGTRPVAGSVTYSVVGMACGVVAASAGGGVASLLSVFASAIFLLLALRR